MTAEERKVGRFDTLKDARSYAKTWVKDGYTVKVVPRKTYDVIIVDLPKGEGN